MSFCETRREPCAFVFCARRHGHLLGGGRWAKLPSSQARTGDTNPHGGGYPGDAQPQARIKYFVALCLFPWNFCEGLCV
jgi:hypothetical protein